MGKEIKYFCDICDAEMKSDTAFIVKVTGVAGADWENEIYVCEQHYKQLKGE